MLNLYADKQFTFSRTGKMPVPQENSLFVEQASCLFIKG